MRWLLGVAAVGVFFWPMIVLAFNGYPTSINLVIPALLVPLTIRLANRALVSRTGWSLAEAEERVGAARRGVLPHGERDRARLRTELHRARSNARAGRWALPVAMPFLIVWLVALALSEDLPILAVAGGVWFAGLAAVLVPWALRSARKEEAEIAAALRLLGDG